MNPALFYDAETTGLPLFHEPSEDPRQPHMVQLGACLVDLDTWKTLATLDVIVRPDGWTIPDDVAAINGITTEQAMDLGVSESMALGMLLELWNENAPRLRVAHNEGFDARIVRIALMRYEDAPLADAWKAARSECTQLLSTPILNLPPTEKMLAARRKGPKSANLREAYAHFTGRELENAHTAIADVLACIEVYRAIKERHTAPALAA
ncbi:MAG: 3'-5' exonuclease [Rubrivivax sp.]|nr:3'-5' exonuclease [Rubrivivax sp.]